MTILKKSIFFSLLFVGLFWSFVPVAFLIEDTRPFEGPVGEGQSEQVFREKGEEREKVKPSSIPCIPGLPCVQESSQQTGEDVRQHILGSFAYAFFNVFLGISAVTSVIFIIVGGTQMRLAFGNDEQINKAKKTLIWAIAGLVISILAVAIVQIISNLPFK